MAHFAELDSENKVVRVIVVSNEDILDSTNQENEEVGIAFCKRLLGGTWKQTSYNNNIRKNYAGVGYTYNAEKDAFIPPKPFPSWILNETSCKWECPVPYPTDEKSYRWDEETVNWIEVQ
jgi:hypothetical protein